MQAGAYLSWEEVEASLAKSKDLETIVQLFGSGGWLGRCRLGEEDGDFGL